MANCKYKVGDYVIITQDNGGGVFWIGDFAQITDCDNEGYSQASFYGFGNGRVNMDGNWYIGTGFPKHGACHGFRMATNKEILEHTGGLNGDEG